MSEAPTIEKRRDATQPAQDLAPATAQQQLGKAANELDASVTAAPARQQGLLHLEPVKRKKTWGEVLFNTTTYVGFALIGNEAAATKIVNQADKQNMLGRAYRRCDEFFKNIGAPGKLPYLQQRMNYISFAIIGGFLMVPFIKMLEDSKDRCVRFADRVFYGKRAETDPEIIKRHEAMDKAPEQTWGSLGKGRVITVAAAYAVDSTINWDKGISARLLKGTWAEKYSSLEHLSNVAADWMNNKLKTVRNLTPEKAVEQQKSLKTLIGLTTLSATLTVLFYVSSKIFAKHHEEKLEHKHMMEPGSAPDADESPEQMAAAAIANARESSKQAAAEKPHPKVSTVSLERTVSDPAALAHSV